MCPGEILDNPSMLGEVRVTPSRCDRRAPVPRRKETSMSLTRRQVLASGLAATGLGAVGYLSMGTAEAASPPGDVVGKITVGYQGWFACIGDGSPINAWWHWSQQNGTPPSPSNTTIVSW